MLEYSSLTLPTTSPQLSPQIYINHPSEHDKILTT